MYISYTSTHNIYVYIMYITYNIYVHIIYTAYISIRNGTIQNIHVSLEVVDMNKE